jgi:hypothetical protein
MREYVLMLDYRINLTKFGYKKLPKYHISNLKTFPGPRGKLG